MYVPACPSEELLKNQFESAAHPGHSTESFDGAPESFVVVMATHDRTAEAARALQTITNSSLTTVSLGSIVFIDEMAAERTETERVLGALRDAPTFLHGDGDVYWSKALRALLDGALSTGADYIVHMNTDVTLVAPVDVLLAPMRADSTVAAVAGVLAGEVTITGYRPIHFWFPFFASVEPGHDAAILPASCVAYRSSALRSASIDLTVLDEYRHGWADVELSCQLREAGYRLATTATAVGTVQHKRYFRRKHNFDEYGGSLRRYIRECPTAPCFADTRRIGERLFGRCWPVMLRVYVPVVGHWLRYRAQQVKH